MYVVSQSVELVTKLEFFDKVRKVTSKKPYASIKIFISEQESPGIQVNRFPVKTIMIEGQDVIDQIDENNNIYNLYKEINKNNYLESIKDLIKEGDIIL